MKRLFPLIIIFTFSNINAVFAQKITYNDANAEIRSVSAFHGIKVSNGIELHLSQGGNPSIAVSASTIEYRNKIKTEVSDGVLKIYYENNNWNGWSSKGKNLKAYVSVAQIDILNGSSGADVLVDGTINANNLSMDFSSGADFDGSINAINLTVHESSGADMDIKGSVKELLIDVSSGSDFSGFGMIAETCNAEASSGAGVEVTVNKDLSANASSGGSIRYKGSAIISKFTKSSGGSIKKV